MQFLMPSIGVRSHVELHRPTFVSKGDEDKGRRKERITGAFRGGAGRSNSHCLESLGAVNVGIGMVAIWVLREFVQE